jgi:hypothetical protein
VCVYQRKYPTVFNILSFFSRLSSHQDQTQEERVQQKENRRAEQERFDYRLAEEAAAAAAGKRDLAPPELMASPTVVDATSTDVALKWAEPDLGADALPITGFVLQLRFKQGFGGWAPWHVAYQVSSFSVGFLCFVVVIRP